MDKFNALLQRSGWRARGLDFLIGALGVFGHAPFHIWPITILCFCYLFWRLDNAPKASFKMGLGRGFWFALGYFLAGIYWISSAFVARGPEFIWLAGPMVLALAAVMALIWGLAGGMFTRMKPQGFARVLFFVSLFFTAEFTRGHILGGFPWGLPGYIFKGGGAISQFASIGGVYGLSLLVFLISALLAQVISSSKRWVWALSPALILAGLFGFGTLRLSGAETQFVEGPVLRVVQVSFNQRDNMDPDKSVDIANQFLTESIAPGIENVTHVIWPEGAVSGLALDNAELIRVMGELLSNNSQNPPVWILNSLRYEQGNDVNGIQIDKYYNTSAAIRYNPEGVPALVSYNDKTRLVPFGEFIPFEKYVKQFGPQTISTSLASITPAKDKENSTIPGLPLLSPQICYEIIFSGLTPRKAAAEDPKWILNQSNDAWYGDSIGPRQHANISQYRAIEEGLPVIRAASNGISGSIDPYGRYLTRVEMDETKALDFQLPRAIKKPFFFANSKWFLLLINLLVGLVCAASRQRQDNVVSNYVQ